MSSGEPDHGQAFHSAREGNGTAHDQQQTDAFVNMAATVRQFQDALAAAAPTSAELGDMTSQLGRMVATLAARQVDEGGRIAGRVRNVPGRAQFFSPPYHWRDMAHDRWLGTVTFGQMYLGTGAVHGGALPLIYDEVMGAFANRDRSARSRTVNLCVRYRALTPIDTPLDLEVRFDREDGRKLFFSAWMMHEGVVLSEAEGIYVTLKPGQR